MKEAEVAPSISTGLTEKSGYGEWTVVQCSRRRPSTAVKGNSVTSGVAQNGEKFGGDRTATTQNSKREFVAKTDRGKEGRQVPSMVEGDCINGGNKSQRDQGGRDLCTSKIWKRRMIWMSKVLMWPLVWKAMRVRRLRRSQFWEQLMIKEKTD